MHFSVLGKSIVVLGSYQAAVDLFDKRGIKYGSRPRFPIYEMYVVRHLIVPSRPQVS